MDALIAQNRGNHEQKWWKRSDILALNLLLTSCLITSAVNGFDGSTLNGLQSVEPWQVFFDRPRGQRLGLLGCIQSVGSIAAIPFSPFLADGLGRKPTILLGSVIMLGAAILSGAAQNFGMFVAAKGLLGFGLQFAQMASPMLVTELAYPGQRAQLTSIFNSLWYVGALISAWTIFGTENIKSDWSWRIPSLLQGLPSVFQLSLILFVPESPRWLVSKGREDQAARIIAKYHAKGDLNDPLVTFEMSEIKEAIAAENEISRTTKFWDLINTKGNRKRIMLITAISFFSQWSGNGLVSYYQTRILTDVGITDHAIQLLINGVLQIFNVIMAVGAAVLVEKLGRRTLFLTSNAGMFVAWSIWTGLAAAYVEQGNKEAGKAVVAFIFIYYAFYDIAYSPLLVAYTVEILPYKIRAKGVAYMNLCVSASLVFNQYANPEAIDGIGWKYYLVYVVWLAFELVFVYFYVIETRGLSLEETALLFDGTGGGDALAGHASAKVAHGEMHDVGSDGDAKSDYVSEKSA